jgi:hypothetical protein
MSQTSTLSPVTVSVVRDTSLRVVAAFTSGLSTVDKKGNRVSFERSVAFASKDARLDMAGKVYAKQCEAGRYDRLVKDALAGGVLNKSQREFFDAMIGIGAANKAITQQFCAAVTHLDDLAKAEGKAPKGQKAFYVGMLRQLHVAFQAGEVQAAGPVPAAVSEA